MSNASPGFLYPKYLTHSSL